MRSRLPMHPWEANSLTVVDTVDEAVAFLAERFAVLGSEGTPLPDYPETALPLDEGGLG